VQASIERQLRKAYERVAGDIKSEDVRLQQVLKEKEELGMRVYNTQQALARLQLAIERTSAAVVANIRKREEAELAAQGVRELEQAAMAEKERRAGELAGHLTELSKLNEELRQVEQHVRDLAGQKAATERAAARAAEEARDVGRRKQEQDFLVDRLNEEVKALQDRIAGLVAQIQAQKLDNAGVAGLLAEADAELESLRVQKKQRLAEWQVNVGTFGKMNEALAQLEAHITERRAVATTLDNEIEGFRARERAAQETRERLAAIAEKAKSEEEYLDRRMAENAKRKEEAALELAKAQRALDALEQQLPIVAK
jgi:chromosome segregation ATPase